MEWLKRELREGVFGAGWANAAICVLLAAGIYLTNEIYSILNHGPNVVFLKTHLDDLIPVVTPFVIPYVSLEPIVYGTLVLFLLFRTRVFQSAALAMIAAWLVSYVFYLFLQSYVDRPALTGTDTLTQMIRGVYASDNPYNDFPSLHTSLSTVLALHWLRVDRRLGILTSIWFALIIASTVFVKQHYVPDVAAGLVLGTGVSWVFLKLVASKRLSTAGGT
jgi:membrane-associated phospholipid phosphatase